MIKNGDCLLALKRMLNNSMDSLVTDPPAGISFMGKEWDGDRGGRKQWVAWMTDVMRECMRVMKPGAHGLVWALPRTSHWTATALEDAGFEVRDVVTHLFGSGFPKSLDVSKAIDKAAGAERVVIGSNPNHRSLKQPITMMGAPHSGDGSISAPATDAAKQWQGFGTALKPASEHWVLVRKPLSEKTVAANVLKWGCGSIAIDQSRVTAGTKGRFLDYVRETFSSAAHIFDNNNVGNGQNYGALSETGSLDILLSALLPELEAAPANDAECDRRLTVLLDSLADCPACCRLGDALTRFAGSFDPTFFQRPRCVRIHNHFSKRGGGLGLEPSGSPQTLNTVLLPIEDFYLHDESLGEPRRLSSSQSLGDEQYLKWCLGCTHTCEKGKLSSRHSDTLSQYTPQSWLRTFLENGNSALDLALKTSDVNIYAVPLIITNILAKVEKQLTAQGRFPANLLFSHNPECMENPATGITACAPGCAVAALDAQSGTLKSGAIKPHHIRTTSKTKNSFGERAAPPETTVASVGGASRFFYCAKISKAERNAGLDTPSTHPTVKPKKLMQYLIRMVTPPGGVVLDPFMGSGSTGVAAVEGGFGFIGIEREAEYAEIARRRLERARG